MRQRRKKEPDPVDVHVAMRMRERRIELGLSQPKVAAELGITFQQLYKYERAKNRIGAARLYELSKVLSVPITFFFEGVEAALEAQTPRPSKGG